MERVWTYRCEYVRCGKKCKSCPHGPYWYRYRRRDKGPMEKEYLGRHDPREHERVRAEAKERDERPWWELMTDKRTANIDLANRVLEIKLEEIGDYAAALRNYRRLCREHHPDRGGDHRRMTAINAAWTYLVGWHNGQKAWAGRKTS